MGKAATVFARYGLGFYRALAAKMVYGLFHIFGADLAATNGVAHPARRGVFARL